RAAPRSPVAAPAPPAARAVHPPRPMPSLPGRTAGKPPAASAPPEPAARPSPAASPAAGGSDDWEMF
ncbi:methyl-accepting chemotaxis protein, partial [Paracidovorax avenae]